MRTRRVAVEVEKGAKVVATMAPIALPLAVAAARYGTSVKMMRRWIHRGLLPAAKPPGTRDYLVFVADLERLLAPKVVVVAPKGTRESESARAERLLRDAGLA
jgi:hypothetical protein